MHFKLEIVDPQALRALFAKVFYIFSCLTSPLFFFKQEILSVDVDVLFMNVKEYESTKL